MFRIVVSLIALALFPASSFAAPVSETNKVPVSGQAPYAESVRKPKALPKVPPRVKQTSLTLLDWNIQVGSDRGVFKNHWKQRKNPLVRVLQRESPDILCVQEGLKEQIDFILAAVPV